MWRAKYQEWLTKCAREGRAELLSIQNNEEEIYERFADELQFGTAGIRGIFGYGTNRINIHTIARATQGLAQYITSLGQEAMTKGVAIAYDTRAYSYTFAKVAAEVLAKNKIQSYLYQMPQPVPILSFTVQKLNAWGGIMITASHNPKAYNGYKVYGASGNQMSVEDTAKIVQEIEKVDYFTPLQSATPQGYIHSVPQTVVEAYYTYVQTLRLNMLENKAKSKLVYTALHGTGKVHIEKLLKKKGVKVEIVAEQSMPDANFSTVKVPNPEMKESLQQAIALANKVDANTVFATDPDADRLGVAVKKENGEFIVLTGNQVGLLLLDYILHTKMQKGSLPENAVVVKSFVSSTLAKQICQSYGVELVDVPVGFKFIGEKISEYNKYHNKSFLFGFEESCGYLYGVDGSKDKDAVLAAVLFAEFACYVEEQGMTVYEKLQELYARYGYAIDKTQNIAYAGVAAMQEMEAAVDRVRAENIDNLNGIAVVAIHDYATGLKRYSDGRVEELNTVKNNTLYFELEGGGFVAVRPSGTEPKLKIYYSIVAATRAEAEKILENVENAFEKFF